MSGPTTNITTRRNDNTSRTLLNANNSILDQRMSTFEPYQIMRDPVQQFCEKHFTSISSYMDEVSQMLPPPTRCSIEGKSSESQESKIYVPFQLFLQSPMNLLRGVRRRWQNYISPAKYVVHTVSIRKPVSRCAPEIQKLGFI